jgi:endonuclease YncB( thermonuclease family)
MQFLIMTVVTAVAVFQTSSFGGALRQSAPLLGRSVIDGNTIDVATVGRVRLLGIDAPAIGHASSAPFGREARERLTTLVWHRWVRLEQEGVAVDVSNRHQAYVVTGDGQFVNAVLVREGLARVTGRPPLTRLAELHRAEAEAQSTRRGMWGNAPPNPPAGYTPRSRATRAPAARSKKPKTRKMKP